MTPVSKNTFLSVPKIFFSSERIEISYTTPLTPCLFSSSQKRIIDKSLLKVRGLATTLSCSISRVLPIVACCLMYLPVSCTCCSFLELNMFIKNILTSSYYFCFLNQLHHCVLRKKTNKTRPHLHTLSQCSALVATYLYISLPWRQPLFV